jgi:hypothetical protein
VEYILWKGHLKKINCTKDLNFCIKNPRTNMENTIQSKPSSLSISTEILDFQSTVDRNTHIVSKSKGLHEGIKA